MSIIAFETNKSFSQSATTTTSSATGLIQFIPDTAKKLGTSVDKLSKMSALKQLDFVEAYFNDYSTKLGKDPSLTDTYLAVLAPHAIGKSEKFIVYMKGTEAYKANDWLDNNNDGISRAEISSYISKWYDKGQLFRK